MSNLANKRVCVTGGAGFLGRAVCARLRQSGAKEIFIPRSREFDLTRQDAVTRMFDAALPDIVIHLAAEVGGIGANEEHPGRFFYANMMMGVNLIEESRRRGVEKFVQVGTVCAYPKFCHAPFHEEDLWSGFPEETNAPYGVAKRALATMLDAYAREYGFNGVYLLPANLYGPGDNFDPRTSHVVAAMIRNFCEAVELGHRRVTCWGTGTASREFLYVDDAAEGIVKATDLLNDPTPINIGTGQEITISDLAGRIAKLCGFHGEIAWDRSRVDGQPRRRLDTSKAEKLLDWQASTSLDEGLRKTVEWWRSQTVADLAVSAQS
ncbi:MAG: GDP-L-fucose synthase [Planctomycetes bacterium]|nr:GDP-L-fucose synthase [Planctomycetota bacterium]MBI3835611.1 GDP-L-fucose synthase [Planctomycetota bacterium]